MRAPDAKLGGVVTALAVLCSSAALSPAGAQSGADAGAANGKRIYLEVGCFTCHGRVGEGGNYNYPVPPLAKIDERWPLEAFRALLRAGPNDMPAYAEAVLSDRQVEDIYTFLESLPGARSAGEIALLNQ